MTACAIAHHVIAVVMVKALAMVLVLQLLRTHAHSARNARACLPISSFLSTDWQVMLDLMRLCRRGNLRQAKGHCMRGAAIPGGGLFTH